MFDVRDVSDLNNCISYVILYAPDRFPREDYLAPEQQMTLESSFELLRKGVSIAYPGDFHPEKRSPLLILLDMSMSAYARGDKVEGIRLLQDFRNSIFQPN